MCQVQRLGEVISRRRNSHEIQQLKRVEEIVRHSSESWRARDKELLHNKKKWTVAEGAIYSDFDKEIHVIDKPKYDIVEYYAGVDWGYDHYGSIVIVGEDGLGNTYIIDGVAERFKESGWWVERAKEFKEIYGDMIFYADSARPEYVAEFRRNGLKAINGNKSVIPGIEEVAKRFKGDSLFYIKDRLPKFEEEIYNYRWQQNSTEDKPIKEHDDVLDALRYAIYTRSTKNGRIKTMDKSMLGL